MKKTIKIFVLLVVGLIITLNTKCYAKTYKGFEVAGEIEIPAVRLTNVILEQVTSASIETAPAVLYGPGLNQVGNTVIIGMNYGDGTLFSDVLNVKKDDVIYIKDKEENRVAYKVYNTFITTADDTSFYARDTLGSREITLSTTTNEGTSRYIVEAKEDATVVEDNVEYKLANVDPVTVGANKYVASVGEKVSVNVGLVNQEKGISKEIDKSKLKIEVSNPDIVTVETDGTVKAKAEGSIKITYTYTDNGKSYTYSEEKFIVSDRFSTGDIPAISNSVVNLKVGGNSENIAIDMVQGGTYQVEYPDGYTSENYYKYTWIVENNTIAKIEKVLDTEIKVSPIAKGTTKVLCTISTADGKESFKKTITVNVSDGIQGGTQPAQQTQPTQQVQPATPVNTTNTQNTNNAAKNTNTNNNTNTKNQATTTSVNNTTAPTVLPKAGLVYGLTMVIIVASVVGIVCYLKYRNIDR